MSSHDATFASGQAGSKGGFAASYGSAKGPLPQVLSRGPALETARHTHTPMRAMTAAVVAPCETPRKATSDQRTSVPSLVRKYPQSSGALLLARAWTVDVTEALIA